MKVKTQILTHDCEEISIFERNNAIIFALKDEDKEIILTPKEAFKIASIFSEMSYEMDKETQFKFGRFAGDANEQEEIS